MQRCRKTLVFLDIGSLCGYAVRKGLSAHDIDRMLCFGFAHESELRHLTTRAGQRRMQEALSLTDLDWCRAWLNLSIEAWERAVADRRVSIHSDGERWIWSPLYELLRCHGLDIWPLRPPVPDAELGADALANAQRYRRDFRWASNLINTCGLDVEVGWWEELRWPAFLNVPTYR